MRSNWIFIALPVVVFVVIFSYYFLATKQHDAQINLSTITHSNSGKQFGSSTLMEQKRKLAMSDTSKEPRSAHGVGPLESPFMEGAHKRSQQQSLILKSIEIEKKHPLELQMGPGGPWSVFSELQVSRESVHNLLFSLGTFHISRKEANSDMRMSLVFNESQKYLGILTGRLIIKVKDLYDLDRVARDYELRVDNISTEIKTAYLNTTQGDHFLTLNSALKDDPRVERFYFEIVRTDWVKN